MSRSTRWRRLMESLKIRTNDPETGVPVVRVLRFNPAQEKVWRVIAPKIDAYEAIRLLILKARREGLSTFIEALLMAFITSHDLVNALITAHEKKAANKIWGMSRFFRNSSPLLTQVASVGNNAITVGRSTLQVATAGTPESERGGDLTAWHASEAAFYPHPQVLLATMQSLPQSDRIFSIGAIESTANGMEGDGEAFYDEWNRAEDGDSDWLPVFLAWHEFTDYQIPGAVIESPTPEEYELRKRFELSDAFLAWRRWAIRNKTQGSVQKFRQEYPSYPEEAFIVSGNPFFAPDELLPFGSALEHGRTFVVEPDGRIAPSPSGWLEIWKLPEPGRRYIIGGDSSMGIADKAGDENKKGSHSRSAGEILDMETLEQVAEYDCVSAPHIFARHLAGMGRLYNHALLAPEVQASGGGGGREVLVYLRKDYDYHHIHQWSHDDDRIRRGGRMMLGWVTNSRTRPKMLARIREVVMEQSAVIHSHKLFKQLSAFGENDEGHTEALAGHDDLLFAYGIALVSRAENYYTMPTPVFSPASIDWDAMGIHLSRNLESGEARILRLLGTPEPRPEQDFMSL